MAVLDVVSIFTQHLREKILTLVSSIWHHVFVILGGHKRAHIKVMGITSENSLGTVRLAIRWLRLPLLNWVKLARIARFWPIVQKSHSGRPFWQGYWEKRNWVCAISYIGIDI
jgi:hypothetical protein